MMVVEVMEVVVVVEVGEELVDEVEDVGEDFQVVAEVVAERSPLGIRNHCSRRSHRQWPSASASLLTT